MVSDQQVKRLWRQAGQVLTLEIAAATRGWIRRQREIPAGSAPAKRDATKHTWRTRPDPFADVWEQIRQQLTLEPGLQAKALFQHLQEAHPACGPPVAESTSGIATKIPPPTIATMLMAGACHSPSSRTKGIRKA